MPACCPPLRFGDAGAGRWPRCELSMSIYMSTLVINHTRRRCWPVAAVCAGCLTIVSKNCPPSNGLKRIAPTPPMQRLMSPEAPQAMAAVTHTALANRVSGLDGQPQAPRPNEPLKRHLSDLKSERDTTATLRSVTAGPHSSHQSRHASTSSRRLCLPALAPVRAPALRCLFQTNR